LTPSPPSKPPLPHLQQHSPHAARIGGVGRSSKRCCINVNNNMSSINTCNNKSIIKSSITLPVMTVTATTPCRRPSASHALLTTRACHWQQVIGWLT